jgi:hypothetical protein
LRRTHSRESGHKHKEESSSSIKSQRRGDKKKKMKKVVYYETDTSSPSTSGSESVSITSKRHERKKYVRCLSAILAFANTLHYFPFP